MADIGIYQLTYNPTETKGALQQCLKHEQQEVGREDTSKWKPYVYISLSTFVIAYLCCY